jgi:hypothetical protein
VKKLLPRLTLALVVSLLSLIAAEGFLRLWFGFPILDAAPFFGDYMRREGIEMNRKNRRNLTQIPGDGHPSARAHRLYGEFLAKFFLDPAATLRASAP